MQKVFGKAKKYLMLQNLNQSLTIRDETFKGGQIIPFLPNVGFITHSFEAAGVGYGQKQANGVGGPQVRSNCYVPVVLLLKSSDVRWYN